MNTKKIIAITTGLALTASATLPTFAQTNSQGDQSDQSTNSGWQSPGRSADAPGHMRGRGMMGSTTLGWNRGGGMMNRGPGVSGTVSSINGNIITISGYERSPASNTASATSFTVDATHATIKKNNATSTISSIAVGDKIFALGTVTGTNIVATTIVDGAFMMRAREDIGSGMMGSSTLTQPFVGNGQPVVAGTIGSISGNTLTITTTSNVTYTVDATNAKIVQGQNTIQLSALSVGETVVVQGVVNGNLVTANTVIDQTPSGGVNPGQTQVQGGPQHRGFLWGIGAFFKHLFGF